MAKKKNKKGRNLILLCCSFLAIILVYLAIGQKSTVVEPEEEEDTTRNEEEIISFENDKIDYITVENHKGSISYVYRDDTVLNKDEKDMPVNQLYGKNMFKGLESVKTLSYIGEMEDLSEFGLDTPSISVWIHGIDGNSTSLFFGDEVVLGEGRYVRVGGSNRVYTVNDTYYNYYNYSKTDMIEKEELPTIESSNIRQVKIEEGGETTFHLYYDESQQSDFSGANYWSIHEPYDKELPGNYEDISTYLENFTSYSLLECVDYKGQELASYGLVNPKKITISYTELVEEKSSVNEESDANNTSVTKSEEPSKESSEVKKEFVLLVGNQVDDKYFVKVEGSPRIYTMKDTEVEELFSYDAFSLVNSYVHIVNIKNVETVSITTSGSMYQLDISQLDKKEDSEEYNYSYKKDGKEVEEDTFKDFFQALIGIKYDREPYDNGNAESEKEDINVEFTLRTGESLSLTYTAYDDNYYIVNRDGVSMFLVDKRSVREVMKILEEL